MCCGGVRDHGQLGPLQLIYTKYILVTKTQVDSVARVRDDPTWLGATLALAVAEAMPVVAVAMPAAS